MTGTDNLSGPTLYSPLTFTVGARANLQFPATQWVGNQLVGTETGRDLPRRTLRTMES